MAAPEPKASSRERDNDKQQFNVYLPPTLIRRAKHAAIDHATSLSKLDGEGREGMLVSFIAEEPLEALERRLREAGFPPQGTVVDQEWGRSLFVRAPDGTVVQIDEQDPELYT